ncbi:MAG: LysM peptidoglycan-binding domain-containing protein, partial [Treponema sp.]|nr:LysM peptidoglycan-binding domain-containing protein [Treponema sp.]
NDSESDSVAAGGISFTGLYDKETEMGESDSEIEEVKKKTRTPVIICVICAIICIIAVLLILFVIPSKLNILNKISDKTIEKVEEPVVVPPVVIPEPEEELVPKAKEDEVIVIEEAEEVIPEIPAPPVEEPKQDIIYKIKWGDTLWDIADTYYKNPWRYKKIANYNGIKDPDYIISGTRILIPQE